MRQQAIKQKEIKDSLILHSDHGRQYQMSQYQKTLEENNIIQSMPRKGNCLDNSVIENFFGALKSKVFIEKNSNQLRYFKIN